MHLVWIGVFILGGRKELSEVIKVIKRENWSQAESQFK